MIRKPLIYMASHLTFLTSAGIRLTKLTGKSRIPIHPKHLITLEKPWYIMHLKNDDTVLDIGCGTGISSIEASKKVKKVIGVDNNLKNLETAKKLSKNKRSRNIEFYYFDVNNRFEYESSSFDKVFVFDVLEHLENRNQFIKELKRLLKNKGTLLLSVDNPNTSWKKLKKEAGLFYYADKEHRYEYPKNEILKILKTNNFRIVSVNPEVIDTPIKPIVDLIGGFSLTAYKALSKWRLGKAKINEKESTGYRIVAIKT